MARVSFARTSATTITSRRSTIAAVLLALAMLLGLPLPAHAATPVIDDVFLSRTTFYPIVRDDYKDSTRINFRQNVRARLVVEFVNSAGVRVRRDSYGYADRGRFFIEWNGRDRRGTIVRPDTYTIRLTGTDEAGRSRTVERRVRVTTDVVTRRRTLQKTGVQTLDVSRQGNCRINRWRPELQLDCWGGRRARATATYQFRLPASFSGGRWEVRGRRGCCDPGQVDMDARRVNDRVLRVHVTVTNWRSFEVRRVEINYAYQHRI